MLDTNTGIQKDLPTPRWLIALRVLKLNILKIAAIDMNTTSIAKIKVHSSQCSIDALSEKAL